MRKYYVTYLPYGSKMTICHATIILDETEKANVHTFEEKIFKTAWDHEMLHEILGWSLIEE